MIINFGSINIDHVYRVQNMPEPGETIEALSYEKFIGGKGLNQSVAIAQAGGSLRHVGAIGHDGKWVQDALSGFNIGGEHIAVTDFPTGHAIIYVDDQGENQIVLAGGANQQLTEPMVDGALKDASPETDWVLLQNETNLIEPIVDEARERGFKIAYSAAPFIAETAMKLINKIDFLAVNEMEAEALANALGIKPASIPVPQLLITKGSEGATLHSDGKVTNCSAISVNVVDTTGAGDTFLGSFLANYCAGKTTEDALAYASAASALQVTREGAATAIPSRDEVTAFMKEKSV